MRNVLPASLEQIPDYASLLVSKRWKYRCMFVCIEADVKYRGHESEISEGGEILAQRAEKQVALGW